MKKFEKRCFPILKFMPAYIRAAHCVEGGMQIVILNGGIF